MPCHYLTTKTESYRLKQKKRKFRIYRCENAYYAIQKMLLPFAETVIDEEWIKKANGYIRHMHIMNNVRLRRNKKCRQFLKHYLTLYIWCR